MNPYNPHIGVTETAATHESIDRITARLVARPRLIATATPVTESLPGPRIGRAIRPGACRGAAGCFWFLTGARLRLLGG
jgi:hypothetical protein